MLRNPHICYTQIDHLSGNSGIEDSFQIKPARSATDLEAIARLFKAYATSLGIDLTFQDFTTELATLPGKYKPPDGELLLAHDIHGQAVGCVALRALQPAGCCEMKRLYVSLEGRGLGLGKGLIDAIVNEAVRIGYREMRLDTLPTMTAAIALYGKAGFVPIEPYYDTPLEETVFLGRLLAP